MSGDRGFLLYINNICVPLDDGIDVVQRGLGIAVGVVIHERVDVETGGPHILIVIGLVEDLLQLRVLTKHGAHSMTAPL